MEVSDEEDPLLSDPRGKELGARLSSEDTVSPGADPTDTFEHVIMSPLCYDNFIPSEFSKKVELRSRAEGTFRAIERWSEEDRETSILQLSNKGVDSCRMLLGVLMTILLKAGLRFAEGAEPVLSDAVSEAVALCDMLWASMEKQMSYPEGLPTLARKVCELCRELTLKEYRIVLPPPAPRVASLLAQRLPKLYPELVVVFAGVPRSDSRLMHIVCSGKRNGTSVIFL